MSKVYVFLADGFEEIEGLTVVDMLRRAGVEVCMTSIMGKKEITGSHNIKTEADALFEECDFSDADICVLPGGMPGTRYLGENKALVSLLLERDKKQERIAAICAAPTVFGDNGILKGRKAVCYPGMEDRLTGAEVSADAVVTDGHITTSRGMGTAIPFALELISILCGKEKADALAKAIVYC